ncbi:MAG: DNA-binding response regulator [Desulfobacca sp. RBG_16_60_12]|nr:MAG: DNA-binding response regulator [Desulfobacca sp. RBG_16_60_12]
MAKEHILVVEDEEDILELLRYNLAKEGFRVTGVIEGEEAVRTARSTPPDLIILDLMLPGMDGLTVCRELKMDAKTRDAPIIMLTAKGEEADIVAGLELGADDYVTKPFSPRVLLARLRAVLRRRRAEAAPVSDSLILHEMAIHPGRHEILVQGRPVDLTATEFRLLHFLARRPGWVFTRAQIVLGVQGEDYSVSDRAVDVQIVGLRKKLGPAGKYIETVRGVGYRLKE